MFLILVLTFLSFGLGSFVFPLCRQNRYIIYWIREKINTLTNDGVIPHTDMSPNRRIAYV